MLQNYFQMARGRQRLPSMNTCETNKQPPPTVSSNYREYRSGGHLPFPSRQESSRDGRRPHIWNCTAIKKRNRRYHERAAYIIRIELCLRLVESFAIFIDKYRGI